MAIHRAARAVAARPVRPGQEGGPYEVLYRDQLVRHSETKRRLVDALWLSSGAASAKFRLKSTQRLCGDRTTESDGEETGPHSFVAVSALQVAKTGSRPAWAISTIAPSTRGRHRGRELMRRPRRHRRVLVGRSGSEKVTSVAMPTIRPSMRATRSVVASLRMTVSSRLRSKTAEADSCGSNDAIASGLSSSTFVSSDTVRSHDMSTRDAAQLPCPKPEFLTLPGPGRNERAVSHSLTGAW
jgi:hypothetical protein